MLRKTAKTIQPSLFQSQLQDMLDSKDPLIALADTLPWEKYETSFEKYYSDEGRPAKPIRLMVSPNPKLNWVKLNNLLFSASPFKLNLK